MIKTVPQPNNINIFENADQIKEWIRCAVSPAYFLDQHGWIIDDVDGVIRFKLFKFQKCTLRQFQNQRYTILNKPRRMGLTWLVCGFSVWMANFHQYKFIRAVSIKNRLAKKLLDRVKFIYKSMPDYLKCGVKNGNEAKGEIGTTSTIELCNNSHIESLPTSKDVGRAEGVSLFIIDEAAHIRWLDEIMTSISGTTQLGGMVILLSTPNGIWNEFHKTWDKAIKSENGYFPILLHYTDYPGRDEVWLQEQIKKDGTLRVAQEILCSFLHSGNPVFEISEVRVLESCSPLPKLTKYNDELLIYELPEPLVHYVIGADTATGEAASWQAFSVLRADTMKQVAEYRSKQPIKNYAHILAETGAMFNNAIIGVERNNMGRAVIVYLSELYPVDRIFIQPKHDPYFIPGVTTGEWGFETTSRTKPLIIHNLASLIMTGESNIVGKKTIQELYTYVQDGTDTHALQGYSDDMVMAQAIALEVIRTTMWVPRDLPIG